LKAIGARIHGCSTLGRKPHLGAAVHNGIDSFARPEATSGAIAFGRYNLPSQKQARWNYDNLKLDELLTDEQRAATAVFRVSARSPFNDPQFSPRTAQGALRTLVED